MEFEENGCDVSPEDEKIKLDFTLEENTSESIETPQEEEIANDESIIEEKTEISKMDVDIKETKNLKAKNDIEDDIRMICGSEELNRSSHSQDKENTIDNNILETLQEHADEPTNSVIDDDISKNITEEKNFKTYTFTKFCRL